MTAAKNKEYRLIDEALVERFAEQVKNRILEIGDFYNPDRLPTVTIENERIKVVLNISELLEHA
jgi:hypothetical protein